MGAKITSLGHAGLDVRLGPARVLCDPWLTDQGAYLGSWHPFPDNGHVAPGDLHDTPAIFISSPRADRFHVETLSAFPRQTRIFIAASPSPRLAEQLASLGFSDVVVLDDWQPHELGGGARLQVVTATQKHLLGATLVLEAGGQVVVIQGDGPLEGEALARLAAFEPAVHVLPLAGASYVPAVLELPLEELTRRADAQAEEAVARFVTAARGVAARHVLPVAGPACFLDDARFELNFGGGGFPDAEDLRAKVAVADADLGARLRVLHPGDAAVEQDASWTFDARPPTEDKRGTLDAYRERSRPARERRHAELSALAEPVDGKKLRSYLRDFFQFEDMTWDLKLVLQIVVGGGPTVWVDFRNKPYRYVEACDDPADYVLSLDAAWMSLVLQDKATWLDLLMGGHLRIRWAPGRESAKLMHHLEHRHDPALFDLVRQLDPALITLQDEQNEYVCQRFCPHRGRDLEYAIIERGVLTCTAHGWRFDLRKGGRCLWGGDTPLLVKEIRPLKP